MSENSLSTSSTLPLGKDFLPKNRSTPRVYIAATRMNDGKTTVALGLISALRERNLRIGFIKPVGQRFVQVDGHKIDEDPILINRVFGGTDPIAEMSPITVEPEFTRKYLQSGGHDTLVQKITTAFDRIAWEKDFVVVEGTGHAGVGSVFDLSNATVAKLLGSKAILITKGGIGGPVDEVALNKALFDQMQVPLVGVIMNKVLPEKISQLSDFARKGFKRIGVDLLGVIPYYEELEDPMLNQICEALKAKFIHGEENGQHRVVQVVVGAMSPQRAMNYFLPGTLLITPGDREDLVLAALSSSASNNKENNLTGIILSDDILPQSNVLKMIQQSSIPVIASPLDCYTVASRINVLTIKTRAADGDKIVTIRNLIRAHLDIDRILKAVCV